MLEIPPNRWLESDRYDSYIGRWSKLVAKRFIDWLDSAPALRWLDVGCGTGALTAAILDRAEPTAVMGFDSSYAFVNHTRARYIDRRASFEVGQAQALPFRTNFFDMAVSGLVLNFVSDQKAALKEMQRVVKPGGMTALYVWDYAGKMEMLRYFWDSAIAQDPDALPFDEGRRFPICDPDRLRTLFESTGFQDVAVRAIDVTTFFRDFDDYWHPFLGSQGPAPAYAMSLSEERRKSLRFRIKGSLPSNPGGGISLTARAWAVSGRVP
ncbi:class I SAM-dependent methyltransferase [Luteimonas sp. SX5]|uniref:Class I SAM-dependent methyltransferase n=1 Tax=Luteimonas galliterrae TaxID=2940486 RepID=A0ABT0MIK9_9GAMM|nr:class I SAM-dependent methyltransferase [Luteimonas galliterrae]MCL1634716.1 class I SAM-dependent methyltransferase [Luteimonas galliterrae]